MRKLDELRYIVTNSHNAESLRGCARELIAEVESLRAAIDRALKCRTGGPEENAVWTLVETMREILAAARKGDAS